MILKAVWMHIWLTMLNVTSFSFGDSLIPECFYFYGNWKGVWRDVGENSGIVRGVELGSWKYPLFPIKLDFKSKGMHWISLEASIF